MQSCAIISSFPLFASFTFLTFDPYFTLTNLSCQHQVSITLLSCQSRTFEQHFCILTYIAERNDDTLTISLTLTTIINL